MNSYIGIDIGTSSVKLMLIDDNGLVIKTIKKTYPIDYPKPGWSEQNPEDWYLKTIEGLQDLLLNHPKDSVKGIGFSGQMHGLVVLDKSDRIIRPAILWNDGRSQQETDFLNQNKNFLLDEVSNIAFSGFTAPKLLWLKKHEPTNFKKIHKIMLPKDYVIYRMTGIHATDISDASGMLLFDVKNRVWSRALCDLCDINIAMLPTVFDSKDIIGNLLPELSETLGLSNHVFCVAGASDNAAAAIGNGVINEGECNISIGTSGTIFVPVDQAINGINQAIHQFSYAEGKTHLMGVILSAASCNQWWIENILETSNYQDEFNQLDALMGQNNIYFLPYLMGERSPHNDSQAKSLFIGMTPETKRSHMTLSVLEGIAFALRDNLEALKSSGIRVSKSRICGGGAQVSAIKTILSAVLNLPLETLVLDDGAAYGAAILCLAADTNLSLSELSSKVIHVKEIVHPHQDLVNAYETKYQHYKKLYPALKELFKEL